MEVYIIGIAKNRNKIHGFRLLSASGNNTEIKDVTYDQLLPVMVSHNIDIKNAKVENGEITGINGSLQRYGEIGKSQAIVILRQIQENGDTTGYLCSDTNGNIRQLDKKNMIEFGKKLGIANGKIVTNDKGEDFISSIDGTYEIWDKTKTKAKTQAQTQAQTTRGNQVQSNLPADVVNLINRIKTFKQYPTSFAKNVVNTIEAKDKCSDKQLAVLKNALNLWSKEEEEAPKQEKDNTQGVKNINRVSVQDALNYMMMQNGQVYTTGFKADIEKSRLPREIVIPDSVVMNGKTYNVSGIGLRAFANTDIVSVTTGKNIIDIGQYAFANCKSLTEADLSKSRHKHLPMYIFANCENLSIVKVGSYIQRVHEAAFIGCVYLDNVQLPQSAEVIAREAFRGCERLTNIVSYAKNINESAFANCEKLKNFNFSTVVNIGSNAFYNTAFTELNIPGNVESIGTHAFGNLYELTKVTFEDGVESIGANCFAFSVHKYTNEYKPKIKCEVDIPRSVKSIGNNAFDPEVHIVNGWTGTVAESHCLGFNIPFKAYDVVNRDNSSNARIKSNVLGTNPVETLYRQLQVEKEDISNPDYALNTSKLVDIPLPDEYLKFLGIERTTEKVEPKIKFKALANYLQHTGDLFNLPIQPSLTRLKDAFYIDKEELYNDNCNRIYKFTYSIKDTLESGSYFMVITDNNLRYLTDCSEYNDITVINYNNTNENVIADPFIHIGDIIGEAGTISGKSTVIRVEVQGPFGPRMSYVNVGDKLLTRYKNHGIQINITRNDCYMYIPALDKVIKMHNAKNDKGKKKCNLLDIQKYSDFIGNIDKIIKKNNLKNNKKFFIRLSEMSAAAVNRMKLDLSVIDEEKEAHLYQVAQQFRKIYDQSALKSVNPNILTPEIFADLSISYWMIPKDQQWLRATGTKSLNKTNEYTIGNNKLLEYKSNQVVKFSNPYMNGQKGAYIFTLTYNGNITGVFASRYSMTEILEMLLQLTEFNKNEPIPTLMQDPYKIDSVSPDLFYDFYDVLYSSSGWQLNNTVTSTKLMMLNNLFGAFHISMYKPTGIFYLTMTRYEKAGENNAGHRRVFPILPIGNMDRALMVATTTNSNSRNANVLKELTSLLIAESLTGDLKGDPNLVTKLGIAEYVGYYKAREMAIAGIKDVEQYRGLIDDRVIYMMGTVHKGNLQRDTGYVAEESYDDFDIDKEDDSMEFDLDEDSTDQDIEDMEDISFDDEDTDINNDIDTDEDDIDTDEDDIYYEDEDEDADDGGATFEQFFETAKSMGITDEQQARAMYINFINQQQ